MTSNQKVRVLCNDTTSVIFTDDQIDAFIDLSSDYSGNDQIFFAAALALDTRAAKSASTGGLRLGDYMTNKGAATEYAAQAQRLRDVVNNTPAWYDVEENVSEMNALTILRNYILRSEP